ncbi:MAG: CAP domain-containing protein [Verrucomicrobiaceae bacterium]
MRACLAITLMVAAAAFLGGPAMAQPATVYSHGDPTAYEQYMLEQVNAARANPGAEAVRLGIDLNQGLAPDTISTSAKQPLAFHPLLINIARGHSDWMLATGIFSHAGTNGTTPTQRAANVGYTNPVAENIGYQSFPGVMDYAATTKDIHDALVRSFGHRVNLMNGTYSVVGLGLRPGTFAGANSLMGTQNFSSGGNSEDSGPFILGVCYNDLNSNGRYDPGEGIPSVRVDTSLGSRYAITSASGGYAIPILCEATNVVTNNLGFPVQTTAWSTVEPIDANFRATNIAASPQTNVLVYWSGGPLSEVVTNSVTIRRPVRINYTLRGTDNYVYDRTMVTAENVKRDLVSSAASPTPTPSPLPTPVASAPPRPMPLPLKSPPRPRKAPHRGSSSDWRH